MLSEHQCDSVPHEKTEGKHGSEHPAAKKCTEVDNHMDSDVMLEFEGPHRCRRCPETGFVMVIDNDAMRRDELRCLLVSAGYRVIEANGAEQALSQMSDDVKTMMLNPDATDASGFLMRHRITAEKINQDSMRPSHNRVMTGENTDECQPSMTDCFSRKASPLGLAGLKFAEIERLAIYETLSACGGNRGKTARSLGVSEKTIYNKMRSYQKRGML